MKTIIFDCNVYDLIEKESEVIRAIYTLVQHRKLQIIVTSTILAELWNSPFKGIPEFFPTKLVGNTVSRVGLMCAGDSLGEGEHYDFHLGTSLKISDALIADAASSLSDALVTEDNRLRNRFNQLKIKSFAVSYIQFKKLLFGEFLGSE